MAAATLNLSKNNADFITLAIGMKSSVYTSLATEAVTPIILKAKKLKAKKGGRILRAAQTISFIAPFATAVGISLLNSDQNEPSVLNLPNPPTFQNY